MIWGAEAEGGSGARSLAERMESRDALQRQDKAAGDIQCICFKVVFK